MLQKGMHPTIIAESFMKASAKAVEYLTEISTPIDLKDKASLLRAATTSLNSKVCVVDVAHPSVVTYIFLSDRVTILVNAGTHSCLCCDTVGHTYFNECRPQGHPHREEGRRDNRGYGNGRGRRAQSNCDQLCRRPHKNGKGQDWPDPVPAELAETRRAWSCYAPVTFPHPSDIDGQYSGY